jgi:hypothetical protein
MRIKPKESDIQQAITTALECAGFTVRHTSAFRQKGPSGVSKGVPDLLCFHPSVPWSYMGLEVKRPGGKLTLEQEQALENREYSVGNSALGALYQAWSWLKEPAARARVLTLIKAMEEELRPTPQEDGAQPEKG